MWEEKKVIMAAEKELEEQYLKELSSFGQDTPKLRKAIKSKN